MAKQFTARLPVDNFPPRLTIPIHRRISPLEAAVMHSDFMLPVSPRHNEDVRRTKWKNILCLTIPHAAFQHDTFSLPEAGDGSHQQHCLFTDFVNDVPGVPVPITVHTATARQLLALLFHLSMPGAGTRLFRYSNTARLELNDFTQDRKELASKLRQADTDWQDLFLTTGIHYAPFFIEECMPSESASPLYKQDLETPVTLRFWCFIPEGRVIHADLVNLISILNDRASDARMAYHELTTPKPKKKTVRGQDPGPPEPTIQQLIANGSNGLDASQTFICARLEHQWERALIHLVKSTVRATEQFDTFGVVNVAHAMRDYLNAGDKLALPPGFSDICSKAHQVATNTFAGDIDFGDDMDDNGNVDNEAPAMVAPRRNAVASIPTRSLSALLATTVINSTHDDRLNGNRRAVNSHYDASRFLPCATQLLSTDAHNENAPCNAAAIFSPAGAGFASYNCASIDPTQRNWFQYFDPPGIPDANRKDLRASEFSQTLIHPMVKIAHVYSRELHPTTGTLVSCIPAALGCANPSQQTSLFRGFPCPERVHLLSPVVLPWMLPLLPLPYTVRHNILTSRACTLLTSLAESRVDLHATLLAQVYNACASDGPELAEEAQQTWLALSLLGYQSQEIIARDGYPLSSDGGGSGNPFAESLNVSTSGGVGAGGGMGSDRFLPSSVTDAAQADARATDQPILTLSVADMHNLILRAQKTIWTRFMAACDHLSVAQSLLSNYPMLRSVPFVTYVAFEGRQPTVSEIDGVCFDLISVANSLDLFIYCNNHYARMTSYISNMLGGPTNTDDVRGSQNRRRLYTLLTRGLRQCQMSVLARAIMASEQIYSISPAARACLQHFARRSPLQRWFAFDTHKYTNLNSCQTGMAHINSILSIDGTIFLHTSTAILAHILAFASHRREAIGIGSGRALGMQGPFAAGKSVIIATVEVLAVPGTTEATTRVTAAAEYISGNSEGLIHTMQEAPHSLVSSKKDPDPASIDAENAKKAQFEDGTLTNKAFDTSDKNKEQNLRKNSVAVHLCIGTTIFAFNQTNGASAAVLSRMLIKTVASVAGFVAPEGFSLTDLALNDIRPVYTGASVDNYRNLQAQMMINDRAEQMGAIPKMVTQHINSLLGAIFVIHQATNPGQKLSARSVNHARNLLLTVGKLGEVTRNSDARLAAYASRVPGRSHAHTTSSNMSFAPHTVRHLTNGLETPRYLTKNTIWLALPLLREQFDNTGLKSLCSFLCQRAYFKKNVKKELKNVHWFTHGAKTGFSGGNTFGADTLPPSANTAASRRHRAARINTASTGTSYTVASTLATLDNGAPSNNNAPAAEALAPAITYTDFNYIWIPFNASTRKAVMALLGQKMSGKQSTLGSEQVMPHVQHLEAQFFRLKPDTDANKNGVPLYASGPIVTEDAARAFERGVAEDVARQRKQAQERVARARKPTDANGRVTVDDEDEDNPRDTEDAPLDLPVRGTTMKNSEVPPYFPVETATPVDAVVSEQRRPCFKLIQHNGNYGIVVADAFLRPYIDAISSSSSSSSSSNLHRLENTSSLCQSISTTFQSHNLEVYPPQMIDLLEQAYPALGERVTRIDPETGHSQTLRQYLDAGKFKYLTTFTELKNVVDTLIEQQRAALGEESADLLDGRCSKALPKWLAESSTLYRNPSNVQMTINLTAPTSHDADWINSAQERQSKTSRVMCSRYDWDWQSYTAACANVGADPFDPIHLRSLPIVERWVHEAMRPEPGPLAQEEYPARSMQTWYTNAAMASMERNLAKQSFLFQHAKKQAGITEPVHRLVPGDGTPPPLPAPLMHAQRDIDNLERALVKLEDFVKTAPTLRPPTHLPPSPLRLPSPSPSPEEDVDVLRAMLVQSARTQPVEETTTTTTVELPLSSKRRKRRRTDSTPPSSPPASKRKKQQEEDQAPMDVLIDQAEMDMAHDLEEFG